VPASGPANPSRPAQDTRGHARRHGGHYGAATSTTPRTRRTGLRVNRAKRPPYESVVVRRVVEQSLGRSSYEQDPRVNEFGMFPEATRTASDVGTDRLGLLCVQDAQNVGRDQVLRVRGHPTRPLRSILPRRMRSA
jgi:hypothetical protein